MNVITESGSMYHCTIEGCRLIVQKPGHARSSATGLMKRVGWGWLQSIDQPWYRAQRGRVS